MSKRVTITLSLSKLEYDIICEALLDSADTIAQAALRDPANTIDQVTDRAMLIGRLNQATEFGAAFEE